MRIKPIIFSIGLLPMISLGAKNWSIKSTKDWAESIEHNQGVAVKEGTVSPSEQSGMIRTKLKAYKKKRSAKTLTISQSPLWQNWNPRPRIAPKNLRDAPVFLAKGPDDYWMFGRYGGFGNSASKGFKANDAKLEGFDIPLKTTPLPKQFNAPGGLQQGLGGYHAWQSRDMVNWVHHGAVTPRFAKWVTTAEYVDGKTYIYYDFPNDQDPHLFIDEDLTDGKPGKNMGIALNDPSHGSDCAVIRDLNGHFHIIFEDWSPINARNHSWDSPLAGHAVSPNGIDEFSIVKPAVDHRTSPTGEIAEYLHPHWKSEDPKRFSSNVAKYEVHKPTQNAYGDWAAISVGGQYYLFCDFHPAGKGIRTAWFTSSRIDQPFEFCGEIGKGHPDPDIGFAEGQFYLFTQTANDYVSPGPWVEKVEARVGVDTDKDGEINQWSHWQEAKESYDYVEGFSKQIATTPAHVDLKSLPEGYGFQVELKLSDTTSNDSKPIINSIEVAF